MGLALPLVAVSGARWRVIALGAAMAVAAVAIVGLVQKARQAAQPVRVSEDRQV